MISIKRPNWKRLRQIWLKYSSQYKTKAWVIDLFINKHVRLIVSHSPASIVKIYLVLRKCKLRQKCLAGRIFENFVCFNCPSNAKELSNAPSNIKILLSQKRYNFQNYNNFLHLLLSLGSSLHRNLSMTEKSKPREDYQENSNVHLF